MRRNHKYRSTVGAVSLLAMLTSAGCLSPLLPHQGLQEAEHLHPPVARVRLASDESEYVVRSDSRIVLRVFTNSGEES